MIPKHKEVTIEALATELAGITADGRFVMSDGLIEGSVDPGIGGNERRVRRNRVKQRDRFVNLLRALVDD
jgi:hypothetical protein